MSDGKQESGVVVVGVDGSEPSHRALAWALQYAEALGLSVRAVQAWQVPFAYGSGAMVLPAAEFAAETRRDLEKTVDEVAAPWPRVQVEQRVGEGHPARLLLDQAEDAQMPVVGSRGHGGFVGAVIGSVSQYCVTHAHCPVLVVRGTE